MTAAVSQIAQRLHDRASRLEGLGGSAVHPLIRTRTETGAKSMTACANVLEELNAATSAYLARKQHAVDETVKDQHRAVLDSLAVGFDLLGSKIVATISVTSLIESASDIAGERDAEAVRRLLVATGSAIGTIAAALSGLEAVRAVGEAVSASKEALDASQVARYRHEQASQGSGFLHWIDAVITAAGTWLFGAESYLLALEGRPDVAESAMYNRIGLRLLGLKPSDFSDHPDLDV